MSIDADDPNSSKFSTIIERRMHNINRTKITDDITTSMENSDKLYESSKEIVAVRGEKTVVKNTLKFHEALVLLLILAVGATYFDLSMPFA